LIDTVTRTLRHLTFSVTRQSTPVRPTIATQTMDQLSVRQATLSDLDQLALLFDQYRQFQGQAPDLTAATAFLRARFDHDESAIFLASNGPQALGFAQLYPSFSSVSLQRVVILNDLFVAEGGRRQQVASRLLAAVEAYAWSHGACRITLNVARTNGAGQALYETRGWKQDDQFFMYHRYPAS
jgi:GNAT superfamily N-acetyltransferase